MSQRDRWKSGQSEQSKWRETCNKMNISNKRNILVFKVVTERLKGKKAPGLSRFAR